MNALVSHLSAGPKRAETERERERDVKIQVQMLSSGSEAQGLQYVSTTSVVHMQLYHALTVV